MNSRYKLRVVIAVLAVAALALGLYVSETERARKDVVERVVRAFLLNRELIFPGGEAAGSENVQKEWKERTRKLEEKFLPLMTERGLRAAAPDYYNKLLLYEQQSEWDVRITNCIIRRQAHRDGAYFYSVEVGVRVNYSYVPVNMSVSVLQEDGAWKVDFMQADLSPVWNFR